jgi:ABC-type phosphate/phosphonate transport system substrate-binding protein
MNKIFFIASLLIAFNLTSCSSSIEETREEEVRSEDGGYVFDDIPDETPKVAEDLSGDEESYFKIQIGAFTTKQRAKTFAEESKKKLGREVEFSYSSRVNLFVVQLKEKFYTKEEAETTRELLRNEEDFKDAWVISVIK